MYFIWLFKIRCHFGQQFIRGNSYIDGKSKLIFDLIFDLMSCLNRIWINQGSSCHIQKNFINRKRFHHRRIRCQYAFSDHRRYMPEYLSNPAIPALLFVLTPMKGTHCSHLYERLVAPYLHSHFHCFIYAHLLLFFFLIFCPQQPLLVNHFYILFKPDVQCHRAG